MLRSINIICIFFFFTISNVNGQNVVPNPGFENYSGLPCGFIYNGAEFSMYLNDWSMPTSGTTDIYSTLTASACVSNCYSTNFLSRGSQTPRTGTTMCGIHTYGFPTGVNYREYLQVKLTSPLVVGKMYYAEFYVSTADNNRHACNNIGMYFSAERITDPSSNTILSFTPQIKTTTIINDTSGWVKISGNFKATEAVEYLTIGNFDADINTSIIEIDGGGFGGYTYYFVDDVLVNEYCERIDTSSIICAGSTTTLNIPEINVVNWSLESDPNTSISTDATLSITPLVNTTYLARSSCGQTSTFNIIVENPLSFELPNDTTICAGQQITLDASTVNAHYLWQNGSENPILTATTTGLYSLTITNSCSSISDEIFIKVDTPPSFNFGDDNTICSGQSMIFDAMTDNAIYLWQDNSTDSEYIITAPGTYSVAIENACGEVNKSITIVSESLPTFEFPEDPTICIGQSITFDATTANAGYLWQNGSQNPILTANTTGLYSLTITNSCGSISDEIYITFKNPIIPNLITPNGDGMNDTFDIDCLGDGSNELNIFNEWGTLVYQNRAYLNNWGANKISDGIYYYEINNKTEALHKGWIQVLK